ncbi:MAG TPA: outer membrane protein assembly factor BamD [Candidatus Mailhella merdavium]|nr:outer membrane protein assembly factor BamD [Candidatus Mailhella merdavium]
MPKLPVLPLLACLMLSGCGLIDQYFLPVSEDTVQEIYENGNDAMRAGEYAKAAESYARIKDDYPFSPYAVEAELSLADAYFLNKKYWEAADAYGEFETLHPRHSAIPYVLYQRGMSLKNTYRSVDQASTEVAEALEYFQRLVQSYPGTEYAEKAQQQIAECRSLLAQREVYIADVFWSMGNYQAAWTRYRYVLENYGDVTDVAEYARKKGENAYLRFRENSAEAEREKRQGSWKDYFRWL